MKRLTGLILLGTAASLLVACLAHDEPEAVTGAGGLALAPSGVDPIGDPEPLEVFPGTLVEGQGHEDIAERAPLAETRDLSDEQMAQLLGRLDRLPVDPDDEVDFALRPGSLPPPRTGVAVQAEFPPDEERRPPVVDAPEGPLQLLRYGPEGAVPIAGQVSMTFDRPMVAVTAHDDTLENGVPATLSPDVPGQWRWVGVRTLMFEPEAARLPMATQFTVSLDAQARAADGSELAEPYEWAFSTPPVSVINSYPMGTGVPLEPVIILVFDQRVHLDTLSASLRIIDRDGRNLAYRAATDQEVEDDPTAANLVEGLEPGRWVALRTEDALPTSTRIELVLEAGAQSAEGLLLTTETQRREFSTYGPFIVNRKQCGWNQECSPSDPFTFYLSNDLDPDQDASALVTVEPEISGVQVEASGRSITILGIKRGQTTYNISFSPELADRFGQQLSGSRSFSFEVGSFRPSVTLGAEALTTLDPMAPPRLEFFSTNYQSARVHIHRVEPSDWPGYLSLFRRQHEWRDLLPDLPGEEVFSGLIEIEQLRDELVRTGIDLAPWLNDDTGHFVVMVGPGRLLDRVPEDRWGRNQITWVQATRIGLDVAADSNRLQVWATNLADGSPLADTRIRIGTMAESRVTDDDGLVSIELPAQADVAGSANWVEATIGADTALLPESRHWGSRTNWHKRDEPDDVLWHVFDDRQMYRPGETVHLKGWLRRLEKRPDGGLGLFDRSAEIRYTVSDSRGNDLAVGATGVAGLGGFDFSFELPQTPNLGDASVRLSVSGLSGVGQTSHTHHFSIQEFRTPEFEVTTRSAPGPFVGSEPIDVAVEAAYYAGGALPGADVGWNVSAEPGHYSPPNRDPWSFGFQTPWWMPWHWRERNGSATQQFEGRTDGGGKHALAINLDFSEQPRPLRITAAATVTDVNRQAWSSSSEILAHPGDVYVGLKSETYFVDRHQPMVIDLLTVDIDGESAGNRPVVVEAKRIFHFWRDGGGGQSSDDVQRCTLSTADDGLGRCEFETDIGGQYQITATTMDKAGRRNATRIVRWVGGGRMARAERVEIEEVMLVPDRDRHAPGDVARLLVQAPFDNAEGLLTLRRHGLAEQRRFTIEGGSATLEIQLRRDWLPNIQAHVTLVGNSTRGGNEGSRSLPPRPAIAVGTHDIAISTAERALEVRISPASAGLAPGESTDVVLEVLDSAGVPVAGAEIALVVVDEAILALTDYRITNPLDVFYQSRPPAVRDHHLRPSIRLLSAADLIEELAQDKLVMEVGMDRAVVTGVRMGSPPPPPGAEADPIDIREDFNPLAAFVPALITDEDGRVSSRISLPDNLTRYRISALAVSGPTFYGKSEATLTARLPLMLRPSPPRFLNFGDVFDFPVVLQNQTDSTVQVQVAMEGANLELTGSRGYSLEVPANDRVEVRFPAAARSAGTARYQMAVATENFADAARGQLPVWTPATTEAFATYGVIDHGAMVQPIVAPTDVWPQFGQLEVTSTSTAVQSLTEAFIYLHEYPFAGSEQIASRMIAVAALRDVLEAFDVADMPSPEEITVSMERDLQRLAGLQNPDGGFGLWRRGHDSWPYSSLHVAHALVRARQKGYEVEAGLFDRTLNHVAHIEQHIPPAYNDWVRRHIVAYSLYVRSLNGDLDRARARALMDEVDDLADLSFESIGWLLGVLTGDQASLAQLRELRRFLANRVTETAASASFVSAWRDGAHLIMQSQRRADGVILEALINDQPASDLIPKIVNGLQAHRTRGRWGTTQENAFILLALDKYFQVFEDAEPDFVARTWLGEEFAGEHHFEGRNTERHHIDIPMSWLARGDGRHDLILDKDGAGRLYYRLGLSYAPRDLDLAAASHGFEVQRIYRAVDDDEDVRLRSDGSWEIRAGARVEIELTLIAPARRYHVALIDPLPAGLESINPALAVSEPIDQDNDVAPMRNRGWWWGPWYEHQNLRDERTEAFATLLSGGVYTYSYYARATTPGQFVVPPARAEEMYHPETFGRSASARVVIVD